MHKCRYDTSLPVPYVGSRFTLDGETHYLYVFNPNEISKLSYWMREFLCNQMLAEVEPPTDGGEEHDNVILLSEIVQQRQALASEMDAPARKTATDR